MKYKTPGLGFQPVRCFWCAAGSTAVFWHPAPVHCLASCRFQRDSRCPRCVEPLSASSKAAVLFRLCFPSSWVADINHGSEVPCRKHKPAREGKKETTFFFWTKSVHSYRITGLTNTKEMKSGGFPVSAPGYAHDSFGVSSLGTDTYSGSALRPLAVAEENGFLL